ncbi:MAG: hypothetical protein ACXW52_25850, partial [Candidatus Binatia bacterium]
MSAKVFAAGSSLLSDEIDLMYCIPHNVGKEFESRGVNRYQHSCRSGEGRAVDGGFFAPRRREGHEGFGKYLAPTFVLFAPPKKIHKAVVSHNEMATWVPSCRRRPASRPIIHLD